MTAVQTEQITRGYRPEPTVLEVTSIEETVTDAYAVILNVDLKDFPETKLVMITNTHASYSLKYSVYGTLMEDPADYDWVTLVGSGGATAEQTVAAETSDYQSTTLAWRRLRVDVKNATGGEAAAVRVILRSVLKTR